MYELIQVNISDNEEYPVNESENIEELYNDLLNESLNDCNIFNDTKGFYVHNMWIWPDAEDELWNIDCVFVPDLKQITKEIEEKNYYQIEYNTRYICCKFIFRKLL